LMLYAKNALAKTKIIAYLGSSKKLSVKMKTSKRKILGVLGGMGPMATVDFLAKLTKATPASRDQEHIPIIVRFCPQIPDRSDAIEGRGLSPQGALEAEALKIERDGAQALVIPCNTAHFWFEPIARRLSIPVLHIADAVVEQLPAHLRATPVGLVATRGTLRSAIYQARHPDIHWIAPSSETVENDVMPAIRCVKAGRFSDAAMFLNRAIEELQGAGAASVVLGCTELPLAYQAHNNRLHVVDATEALARRAVRWAIGGEQHSHNRNQIPYGNFLA